MIDVLERIKPVSATETYAKVLVYGDPGAGKTFLGCTAPDPLVILAEPDISKPTIMVAQKLLGKEIPTFELRSWNELGPLYEYLASGQHPFKTVVLDSLTDMARELHETVLGTAKGSKATHDPDLLERGDWYRLETKLRNMIRAFRDLDMHVVCTALVGDTRNDTRQLPLIRPAKLAQEVPAFFSLVAYLEAANVDGKPVRKLYTRSDSYIAKDLGGLLPPVILNPDLATIFDTLAARLEWAEREQEEQERLTD